MATYFIDPIGGNNANDGLSFANRKKTVPSLSASDVVKFIASPAAVDTGLSGVWTGTGSATSRRRVTWTGAVTKTVDTGNSAWTASANVTRTGVTGKTATNANQLAIASGFTTGKVAYFATGTIDVSAYKQLSFHIQCTSGTVPASSLKVCLCSDTTGDTIVDSFVIDFAMPATSRWFPITIDKGSALGSSIASISIHADSDPGTVTIIMGKVIACKDSTSADALTLNSLVGKSTATATSAETWWPIRNILDGSETDPADSASGPMLEFEDIPNGNLTTRSRGYVGASATTNIYRRQPMPVPPVTSGNGWITSSTGSISISGGWDRTAMTTQSDTTFISGGGSGIGASLTGNTQTITGFGFSYFDQGSSYAGTTPTVGNMWAGAVQTYGHIIGVGVFTCTGTLVSIGGSSRGVEFGATSRIDVNNVYAYTSSTSVIGINVGTTGMFRSTGTIRSENHGGGGILMSSGREYTTIVCKDNGTYGLRTQSLACGLITIKDLTCTGNGTYALITEHSGRLDVLKMTSSSNSSGSIQQGNSTAPSTRIYDASGVTDSSIGQVANVLFNYEAETWLGGYPSGASHRGYVFGAEITSETTDVDGAGGKAWKVKVTSTNRTAFHAVRVGHEFGERFRKYVGAGTLVTITVRAKKGDSIIGAQLRIPGGQLGMSITDVTDAVTAVQSSSGGYATYTVTCTPVVAGWLEYSMDAWYVSGSLGANSWLLFDTFSVTQA